MSREVRKLPGTATHSLSRRKPVKWLGLSKPGSSVDFLCEPYRSAAGSRRLSRRGVRRMTPRKWPPRPRSPSFHFSQPRAFLNVLDRCFNKGRFARLRRDLRRVVDHKTDDSLTDLAG